MSHVYISGSVIPLVSRAHSRWVFIAAIIPSVPPQVIVPAPAGLLNILGCQSQGSSVARTKESTDFKHMDITSASIFLTVGNTSECSGLATQ